MSDVPIELDDGPLVARSGQEPILEVRNLVKHFPITRGIIFQKQIGTVQAVDDISFDVERGKITAIIGESGSGKSVACYSLLGLIPMPPGRVDVYMKRTDAHSISDRIDLDKLGEKIYFVRDVARQRGRSR